MSLAVGTTQNSVVKEKALENQGIITGAIASGVCGIIGTLPNKLILKDMQKMNDQLSASQITEVRNALQTGLSQSGLLQKGVKFVEVLVQKPQGFMQNFLSNTPVLGTFFGKNACFIGNLSNKNNIKYVENNVQKVITGNTILVPENKMVYSWFHEMGHALNFNCTKTGNFIQKMRGPAQIAAFLIIPMVALFSKKRNEQEGKKLSTYDKTINFIRNNAGKLTFLCFVPSLIEEGMATAKGQKWAEKLLSSNLAKNVLKHNKLAFLTYAITALATGYCAYAGVRAKDKYIETKKKQQQNKIAA